jgi:hypothetical protein
MSNKDSNSFGKDLANEAKEVVKEIIFGTSSSGSKKTDDDDRKSDDTKPSGPAYDWD